MAGPDAVESLVIVVRGIGADARLELDPPVVVGRGADADVQLRHPLISRRHAELTTTADGHVLVRDLETTNGTVANGERLQAQALDCGWSAVVQIGPYELLVAPAAPGVASTAIFATDVGSRSSATTTLLFSDIVDSTRINVGLGDHAWRALRAEHDAIVRRAVAAHRGRQVKSMGDGFMLAFPSAADGLAAATCIQRALAARNGGAEHPLVVRMGLHVGEAVVDADDFVGAHVAFAARLATHATGGEVLVSDLLVSLVGQLGTFRFGPSRAIRAKGWEQPQVVYPLRWEEEAPSDASHAG
jgi:class 3 adenylate cyclase